MISYLSGKVIKKTHSSIVVNVNGVGYKVTLLPNLITKIKEKEDIKIFTHQYVRENEVSLYGFLNFKQLETFELLISISGVGPKLALNIISTTKIDELRQAVLKTDISVLTRIPGIGKKSASKIMLELSNKMDVEQNIERIIFTDEDKLAVEALVNLGFRKAEASRAIQEKGRTHDKLENKIKAGLRYLNR
jgi:Holliday junction DNA helicase RuvA